MTANSLSLLWAAGMRELCNHLWQSTLFAGVVLLLAHILRKYQARTRYWLWMAASVKFLIPFSLLAVAVGHLQWLTRTGESQAAAFTAMHQMSQPFTEVTGLSGPITSLAAPATLHYPLAPLVLLLSAVWMLGCITVLAFWFVQWSRVARSVRTAKTLHEGREVEALRRMERTAGSKRPIDVISSPDSMEPGVFGILRPVLLWPQGISRHLDDAHLEAVLAHEVCHVRWRDNLTAMLPMLVSAIFWFHPLVWWMKQQLVKERELACDEEVVHLCNQPQVYAESILKICEFCIESPLPCVSGITGADLKKRVKQIMTGRIGLKLSLGGKLVLAAVVLGVAALGLGILGSRRVAAQVAEAALKVPKLEVVSIRLNHGNGKSSSMGVTADGFVANNYPLSFLIRAAFQAEFFSNSQVVGMPEWAGAERYDIASKVNDADVPELRDLTPPQRLQMTRTMAQTVLTDRFQMKAHVEDRETPMYALVVAKGGAKLKEATPGDTYAHGFKKTDGSTLCAGCISVRPGEIVGQGATIASLVNGLTGQNTGRVVSNKTGLMGKYDFMLRWTPEQTPTPAPDGFVPEANGPSVFTAIEEQLGLKLESTKGPVKTLVIDHIERPSEN